MKLSHESYISNQDTLASLEAILNNTFSQVFSSNLILMVDLG